METHFTETDSIILTDIEILLIGLAGVAAIMEVNLITIDTATLGAHLEVEDSTIITEAMPTIFV